MSYSGSCHSDDWLDREGAGEGITQVSVLIRNAAKTDKTTGNIKFMGEVFDGTIVYGESDAEPLLGVNALESAGIEVDPGNQAPKRLPTTRLKAFR